MIHIWHAICHQQLRTLHTHKHTHTHTLTRITTAHARARASTVKPVPGRALAASVPNILYLFLINFLFILPRKHVRARAFSTF
jgi:hypothetical protein